MHYNNNLVSLTILWVQELSSALLLDARGVSQAVAAI